MLNRFRSAKSAPWVVVASILFAFVALGIVGVTVSYVYEAVYHQYATSKARNAAEQEFQEKCTSLATAEEIRACFGNAVNSARETQRAEEDLYAQKQMAQWAFWILLVTGFIGVVTIAITIVGIYFVVQTLVATQKANAIMREEQRPWLKVSVEATRFVVIGEGRVCIHTGWTIENVGKTPALNVQRKLAHIMFEGALNIAIRKDVAAYHDQALTEGRMEADQAETLLPGDFGGADGMDHSFFMTIPPIQQGQAWILPLAYSVTYQSSNLDQIVQTAGCVFVTITARPG